MRAKNLRTGSPFRSPLNEIVCVLILPTAVPTAASAYMIVLRDGRRIEIASAFSVTKSTFTSIRICPTARVYPTRLAGCPSGGNLDRMKATEVSCRAVRHCDLAFGSIGLEDSVTMLPGLSYRLARR